MLTSRCKARCICARLACQLPAQPPLASLPLTPASSDPTPLSQVSAPQDLPEHGVRVAFVELANTKLELLEPLGQGSPIAKFLERNAAGGV